MKKYKVTYYGRQDCHFCQPWRDILEKYWQDEIDSFKECTNYSEAVPRLTAFNLGGKVLGSSTGVLNEYQLEEFLKKVKKDAETK